MSRGGQRRHERAGPARGDLICIISSSISVIDIIITIMIIIIIIVIIIIIISSSSCISITVITTIIIIIIIINLSLTSNSIHIIIHISIIIIIITNEKAQHEETSPRAAHRSFMQYTLLVYSLHLVCLLLLLSVGLPYPTHVYYMLLTYSVFNVKVFL